MPDPITVVGAGLAVLGSKDILTKLLGPTADYVGGEIADFVEKCNINLDNIFDIATKKLGDEIQTPGAVSPRVLKHVIDEGRFCEDELAAEYYGGMLAASRDVTGLDDRCLPHLSKVKQMSVYQIRTHYAFYFQVLKLHRESGLNLGVSADLPKAGLYLPHQFLVDIFPSVTSEKYWDVMTHSIVGLSSLGLINSYAYGDVDLLKKRFPEATEPGIYLEPNYTGAELFLWALGVNSANGHKLFFEDPEQIELAIPIQNLAQKKSITNNAS